MAEMECPELKRELEESQTHNCGHKEPLLVVRRHQVNCELCKELARAAKENHCLEELGRLQNYISLSLLVDLMGDVSRGVGQYGDYQDLQQALYVIRGEWFELRDEFEYSPIRLDRIRDECLDVAATAIRLAEEIDRGSFQ